MTPFSFSQTLAKCCKEDQLDQGGTTGHAQVELISNESLHLHPKNAQIRLLFFIFLGLFICLFYAFVLRFFMVFGRANL